MDDTPNDLQAADGHDLRWRRVLRILGRTLIVGGLLVLGYLVFELWGTGLHHSSAQRRLRAEFEAALSSFPEPPSAIATTSSTSSALAGSAPDTRAPARIPPATEPPIVARGHAPSTTATPPATTGPPSTLGPPETPAPSAPPTAPPTTPPPTVPPPRPEFADGDPVARLEIPRIGVDQIVVAGVGVDQLRQGPGHYRETPLPGEHGNTAIAGHRTTYGAPFGNLDQLAPGDEIVTTTYAGRFVYRVTATTIVTPLDVGVIAPTPDDRLTLTSCHPKYSARERIIVSAALDPAASSPAPGVPAPPPPSPPSDPATTVAATSPPTSAPATTPPSASVTAPPTTAPTASVVERTPRSTSTSTSTSTTTSTRARDPGVLGPGDGDPPAGDAVELAGEPSAATGQGWFEEPWASVDVVLWSLLCALLAAGAVVLGALTRHRLVSSAVVAGPFLVALYFVYLNLSRILPAGA